MLIEELRAEMTVSIFLVKSNLNYLNFKDSVDWFEYPGNLNQEWYLNTNWCCLLFGSWKLLSKFVFVIQNVKPIALLIEINFVFCAIYPTDHFILLIKENH